MTFATIDRKTWNIAVTAIVLAMIVVILLIMRPSAAEKLPVYSTLSDEAALMDYTFTNHLGERVTMKDYKGKVLVVDFIFTHCPTICPGMTRQMNSVQDAFAEESNLHLLSFSVDPERDTVERMQYFTSLFEVDSDRWHFLTGEKKEIYEMARKGFTVTAMEGDGGPDDFIHSPVFVLVDTKGRLRGFYDGTDSTAVAKLKADLPKLL